MIASATQRIRGLLRSIPPDLRFTDLRWSRELLQHFIGDEALIDAAQRIHGSLQNALRVRNDLRKFLQRTSTPEYLRIVEYGIYGISARLSAVTLRSVNVPPSSPSYVLGSSAKHTFKVMT
jgi:hypothetical protein